MNASHAGAALPECLVGLLVVAALLLIAAPSLCGCHGADVGTAEARAVAGALWTAVAGQASAECGRAVEISAASGRAGFDSAGRTTPPRWAIVEGAGRSVTIDCATGAHTTDGESFTVAGTGADVDAIRVRLRYPTAHEPPRLQCSADAGRAWTEC